MDAHENARTTPHSRMLIVERLRSGWSVVEVAAAIGVTAKTVRKWRDRFATEGEAGLRDRSSRPRHSPARLSSAAEAEIEALRRQRLSGPAIARQLGRPVSTVGAALRRLGLGRLAALDPPRAVIRYERERPGELIHLDTKKLGRIERIGHRITGNRRDTVDGAGWEFLFVAVDDHARIGFTDLYPDERKHSAVQFLRNSVAYFASLGVRVKRVLTDNGSAFRSKAFAKACQRLGLKHSFTRAYRPQTNGKAERFIQSALREWAYGIVYNHSTERAAMLERWTHHYNWHRPHQGIRGLAPISRLPQSRNNLLTLHN